MKVQHIGLKTDPSVHLLEKKPHLQEIELTTNTFNKPYMQIDKVLKINKLRGTFTKENNLARKASLGKLGGIDPTTEQKESFSRTMPK